MADDKAGAPALDTSIESGKFDEKAHEQHHAEAAPPKKVEEGEEDEDEDIDALIEDLESNDGHDAVDEEEEEGTPGGGRVIPEDMLQTDSRVGLTESEVTARRRKYGLNQMKEEKENLILKFFSYFIGPIQFVMEVSIVCLFAQNFSCSFCAAATLGDISYSHLSPTIVGQLVSSFTLMYCLWGFAHCLRCSNSHRLLFLSALHSSRVFFVARCRRWSQAQIASSTRALVGLQQLALRTGWLQVEHLCGHSRSRSIRPYVQLHGKITPTVFRIQACRPPIGADAHSSCFFFRALSFCARKGGSTSWAPRARFGWFNVLTEACLCF